MNNAPALAEKLSRMIRCQTVSYNETERFDEEAFRGFVGELEKLYPACHREMKKEAFNDFALLYTWEGSNPALPPAAIIAHYDVVPAEDAEGWTHPPFDGVVADGLVWGRGAVDIKNQICTAMEACERMIAQGIRPERTLCLAWGGDEEVSGPRGARVIAEELAKRGLRFAFLMDEGGMVSPDQIAMTDKPVALIGVEEKGLVNLTLSCRGQSGHSSMPPAHTAIGVLSNAIRRLESRPFPARLTLGTLGFFRALAPHTKGAMKIILKNPRLFGGLLKKVLSSANATNAMIRTSQSVTMIRGGNRENVLPDRAECNINLRILPGETVESVKKRVEKVVADPAVRIELNRGVSPNDPVLIRSLDTPFFEAVCETVKEVYPGAVPAPYLMMGGTDSKNYEGISDNIFRFTPMILTKSELDGMHGIDERISVENLERMTAFYSALIKRTCLP